MNAYRYCVGLGIASLVLCCGCQKEPIEVYHVQKERLNNASPVAEQTIAEITVSWPTPSGWTVVPVGPPLVAKFTIPVSSRTCDLTVTQLPGDAGGLLANVNRWCGQLGLPSLDQSALDRLVITKKLGHFNYRLIKLTHDKRGMSVGILQRDSETWFFKLSGTENDVNACQTSFEKFLSQVSPKG